MSYGKHYTIQAMGLSNKMFIADIYEKGYSGAVVSIDAGTVPFMHALINASDDAFSGVVSSTLDIEANITNFVGTLPNFASNDDRQYWVNFYSYTQPTTGNSSLIWQMYETNNPVFLDCNIKIDVNGVNVVYQFVSGYGQINFNTGDIVTITLPVFLTPLTGEWNLQVQQNGSDIYNTTLTTVVIGANQTYTFTVANQAVYSCIAKSFSGADPGPSIPQNSIVNLFQGYILSDQVQMPFNTGYLGLKFTCTDGFAMLKNIPYVPINRSNPNETLLAVILNCLNQIQLPNSYYLNVCISVFATGMNDRGAGSQYEPFSQIYYAYRNWLTGTGANVIGTVQTSPYMSCYDVLNKIATSFGCVIRQSGSDFYIGSVAEMAGTSIYYTKYNSSGGVVANGTKSINKTVIPYTTTAAFYFINGSQHKILRKGFPDFQIKCAAAYSPQCIDNGTMTTLSYGFPYGWNFTPYGGVTATSLGPYNAINLAPTSGTPPYNVVSISPGVVAPIYIYDKLNLSFWIDGQATPSSTTPKCFLYIILNPTGGGSSWYVDQNGNWVQTSVAHPNAVPYNVIGSTANAYQSFSVSTLPAPTSGTITLTWQCNNATTLTCTVANVVLTYGSQYQYHLIKNSTTNLSYQKILDLPMGGASDVGCMTQVGSLVDVNNLPLSGWYRYGTADNFDCLLRLVYQEMLNVITVQSVNFDCDIMSIFGTSDPIAPFNSFQVQDSTGVISASGNYYLLGNSEIDYCNDYIKATLLQTSNTDLSATITEINVPQNNY